MRKNLKIPLYISAAALLAVYLSSCFSFNYYYLYGHIENFSDFVFCFLQWAKLAGIVFVAASVFLKSKRFSVVLKYIYILLPIISLFWIERYCGLTKVPQNEIEWIYFNINNFISPAMIKALFVAEAVLMSLTAVLTAIKDGYAPKTELKKLVCFLPVFALTMPFNILENLAVRLPDAVYRFFLFKNFSVWHFASFLVLVGGTIFTYRFLKNKSRSERYRLLSLMAIILFVQYMSRASMLVGDGYNVYYTIIAFLPLFVCNIGVFMVCLAVFTQNKLLSKISFFVHAPGAISVFVYFGKANMSNFGTIFSYTFLYFVFTHAALFVLCVLPMLLKEQRFRLKDCLFPLGYYAVFIFVAAVTAGSISSLTFSYGSTSLRIYPNFSFTQNSPIENSLPKVLVSLFGLEFDVLYLAILFSAYVLIFFAFYLLYYFTLEKKAARQSAKKPDALPRKEAKKPRKNDSGNKAA